MHDNTMNKLANVHNIYQGDYKRVLFCCSAGLLRSATAQVVFSAEPYNWNCRNCGVTPEYALIDLSMPLIMWAAEIYVMNPRQIYAIKQFVEEETRGGFGTEDFVATVLKKCFVLNVEDKYRYRSPELMEELKRAMDNAVPASEILPPSTVSISIPFPPIVATKEPITTNAVLAPNSKSGVSTNSDGTPLESDFDSMSRERKKRRLRRRNKSKPTDQYKSASNGGISRSPNKKPTMTHDEAVETLMRAI